MGIQIKKSLSKSGYYFRQFLYLIPIAVTIHYCQLTFLKSRSYNYEYTTLDVVDSKSRCQQLSYEILHLRKEIIHIRSEIEELQSWQNDLELNSDEKHLAAFDVFYSDQIGLFDYAAEYAGGYIISTPKTIPYPSRFGLRLFGIFDFTRDSHPNVILQHASFPGKCFAFYGNKARIRVALGRPIIITHVSLEHLRLGEELTSAPKYFQVLGLGDNGEENLGEFLYDLSHSIIQTFRVSPRNQTFRSVELRILSNYGNDEFTCVYRFRVHSSNLNLK